MSGVLSIAASKIESIVMLFPLFLLGEAHKLLNTFDVDCHDFMDVNHATVHRSRLFFIVESYSVCFGSAYTMR